MSFFREEEGLDIDWPLQDKEAYRIEEREV